MEQVIIDVSVLSAPILSFAGEILINDQQKKDEIQQLMVKIDRSNHGEDEVFLAEYIAEVIQNWSHDLDKVIICLHDLVTQIPSVKNRK
jgi:uncharacterized membrane-anchored protein YjiN (DUF445 family)